jgi:hypothetical protein
MTLRENIDALKARRQRQAFDDADALFDAVLSGRAEHPDAPHPDPQWRLRSRRAFERARVVMGVWHLPWHHRETWLWAASIAAGVDWIECAVVTWEREALAWHRRKRQHERRRSALPFSDEQYVYEEGDGA